MNVAYRLPHRMTVAEFQDWVPPDGKDHLRWELVDGEPVCMAPPSRDHGAIQNEAARLIGNYLAEHRPGCTSLVTPGVIPRFLSETNERIPDLGVTCSPARAEPTITDPVLLIEILSPSNEAKTRANVWAYTTIPSVAEVLLLSSTEVRAELLRRDVDGWPATPARIGRGDVLCLASIGYEAQLLDFYRTTSLV
jgi:Uma2 family endonuclease